MEIAVGWKAWDGHARLMIEPNQTLAASVRRVLETTNWHALSLRTKELFHSRCHVTIEFTYGRSGLVKLAVLADRRCFVLWLALRSESISKMQRRTWASGLIRSKYVTSMSFSNMLG